MSNQNRVDFSTIFEKLYNFYGDRLCSVDKFKDPYKILISCIISLRTKDEITEKSSNALFSMASDPYQMLKLSSDQISQAIFPAGFYRKKGEQILYITKTIIEKHNGRVPDNLNELLLIKGIGRKSANLVLSLGYQIPAICVDTHVHRISNRIGLVETTTPEKTEIQLSKKIEKDYWIRINNLFVLHGKNICVPISPKCSNCPISSLCKKNSVNKSR